MSFKNTIHIVGMKASKGTLDNGQSYDLRQHQGLRLDEPEHQRGHLQRHVVQRVQLRHRR